MSELSCYNGYSWHVTAPRRLNSPGISKKQLPISALQPLIRMHCSWGNTRRNKIIWVFAIPVSAVHCKMPEGKKKSQTDKPFIWFSFCLSVFFLYSVKDIEHWLIDTEGLSITLLYHTPSAKQQRSGHSILQRKYTLIKQNNLLLESCVLALQGIILTVFWWKLEVRIV